MELLEFISIVMKGGRASLLIAIFFLRGTGVKGWWINDSSTFLRNLDRSLPEPKLILLHPRTSYLFPTKRSSRLRSNYKGDDENDDADDDDDEPPTVDISKFRLPTASVGLHRGRSTSTNRLALGKGKTSTGVVHICTNCGSESIQWMGRCPSCLQWNTMQKHAVLRTATTSSNISSRPVFGGTRAGSWLDDLPAVLSDVSDFPTLNSFSNMPVRITDLVDEKNECNRNQRTRIVIPNDQEINTVLGGGIVPGSLILVGGDPGVGKSTLLLQAAASVASMSAPIVGIGMGQPTVTIDNEQVGSVWYVSGEENPQQIAGRAARLGIDTPELFLLRETHVDTLCQQIVAQQIGSQQPAASTEFKNNYQDQDYDASNHNSSKTLHSQSPQPRPLAMLVIDSIQTMVCDAGGSSAAGGVTQVRECVAMFLRLAKSTNVPILLVGHVTKSGDVAGPRTVEHMVDAVLYLEGTTLEGGMSNLRILRASKNRFGSADEVGVYEMTAGRLLPVSDPSSLFLAHRNDHKDAEGCAIAVAVEGMRALTVEVQALVAMASGDSKYCGRRNVNGVAQSRLLLLLGVLQKRCGMFFARQDVYVNIVGRMRLDRGEGNAADLAVAISLASSLYSIPVRSDTAFVGEVGLLGELRSVPALEKRLQEARRMGFSRVVTPRDYSSTTKKRMGNKNAKNLKIRANIHGVECIQCESLQEAINEGLVSPIPKRNKKRHRFTTTGSTCEQSDDLNLEMILLDDQDDEYEDADRSFE